MSINQTKLEAMRRLQEEYKELSRRPLPNFGIVIQLVDEDNLFEWKSTLLGPKDTCYKGGLFHLRIRFPDNYPNSRPEIFFETPIYHLNVKYFVEGSQPLGHINYSNLNDWRKEYRMSRILPEIAYLLGKSNPECAYDDANNTRRNEFINNRALFEEKAKYFTKKYANPLRAGKIFTTDWDFSYNK